MAIDFFSSRLRGTVKKLFQLESAFGAQLKSNLAGGAALETRDPTDAAFAIHRAADAVSPDDLVTLRQLAAAVYAVVFTDGPGGDPAAKRSIRGNTSFYGDVANGIVDSINFGTDTTGAGNVQILSDDAAIYSGADHFIEKKTQGSYIAGGRNCSVLEGAQLASASGDACVAEVTGVRARGLQARSNIPWSQVLKSHQADGLLREGDCTVTMVATTPGADPNETANFTFGSSNADELTTDPDTSYALSIRVVARRGGGKSNAYWIEALVRTDSGNNVSVVGVNPGTPIEDDPSWNVNVIDGGGIIRIVFDTGGSQADVRAVATVRWTRTGMSA